MNGLELSRSYWETVAKPDLEQQYPELLPHVAVGLVGNGSECFGYDDERSRDHDWGIDFFLWVREENRAAIPTLQAWKEDLMGRHPPEYARRRSQYGALIDVMSVCDFYQSLIGVPGVPQTIWEWRLVPEENFALAVNGAVFFDPFGAFTAVRQGLLDYYPEDLRRKKIAARCMAMAQTGQYNYRRTAERGEWVTLELILSRFISETMGLVYHLNRTYRPYYKWTWRRLRELPVLGAEIFGLLLCLTQTGFLTFEARRSQQVQIEAICALLAQKLREQGLSSCTGDFLARHGEFIQNTIQDARLKSIPPQYE